MLTLPVSQTFFVSDKMIWSTQRCHSHGLLVTRVQLHDILDRARGVTPIPTSTVAHVSRTSLLRVGSSPPCALVCGNEVDSVGAAAGLCKEIIEPIFGCLKTVGILRATAPWRAMVGGWRPEAHAMLLCGAHHLWPERASSYSA